MLFFEECQLSGYAARTRENIARSDATLAIALNFKTAGEKLTRMEADKQGKLYFGMHISKLGDPAYPLEFVKALSTLKKSNFVLNVAGNGIYTLGPDWPQNHLNRMVYGFLFDSCKLLYPQRVDQIISGGQTGLDEAGVVAAVHLGISAKVLAPQGWAFRDKYGVDIKNNPSAFMARFLSNPEQS